MFILIFKLLEKSVNSSVFSNTFCHAKIFFIPPLINIPTHTIKSIEIVIQTINSIREKPFNIFFIRKN
ncbi:MAG: hypothetical protein Q8S84_04910 [bacterium]|nr:hypothetical protein [bacterium]MDP3380837.1 hypothetical protein [bacterium]